VPVKPLKGGGWRAQPPKGPLTTWHGKPPALPRRPASAGKPRLESPRHPATVGTYGPAVIHWAERRRLHPRASDGPRYWQRHALHRALEYDANGHLVWPVVIISAPRQQGKSWIERMVCGWRMDTGQARWHEEQAILHLAHKLAAAKEVWRPAARYYGGLGRRVAVVRYANDAPGIELADGSRWLLQAANEGAGVAFALSMTLIDEAWRVARSVFENGVEPTMAESVSPQTWLVSTAGTSDSDLMLAYRAGAIAGIERGRARPGDALIIEYSVPTDAEAEAPVDIDDPAVWRAGQAHWDARRKSWLERKRRDAGERAFRQQGLNQWQPSLTPPALGAEAWPRLVTAGAPSGQLAFGAEVTTDHSWAVIVAVGGGVAEVITTLDHARIADPLATLAARHHGVVGLDASGPAGAAADTLAQPGGPRLVRMGAAASAAAAGQCFDTLTSDTPGVRLRDHPTWSAAVSGARKRKTGKTWQWDRDGGPGETMIALSAALWAAAHAPADETAEDPRVFV
jgi:hypothetical protein